MDAQHEVIAALGEPAGALSPLSAELAALEATVKTAVARGHATYLCTPIARQWSTSGRIGAMTTPCPARARRPDPCGGSSCASFPGGSISRPTPSPKMPPGQLEAKSTMSRPRPRFIPKPETIDNDKPATPLAQ